MSPRAGWLVSALVMMSAYAGCKAVTFDRENRICERGECLDGYRCHPELNICGAVIDVGCDAPAQTCPDDVETGDACPSVSSFIPCYGTALSCDSGCRTCLADGTWSECSAPSCDRGTLTDCAFCGDDCTQVIQHATPTCTSTTPFRCDYEGPCAFGFADANGDRSDGCECASTTNGVELCDGLDNDCDTAIDEDFECLTGATRECTTAAAGEVGRQSCIGCYWSSCEAVCDLGLMSDCAACGDDCSVSVANATPICNTAGLAPVCDYQGACTSGFIDVDGVRENGCECAAGACGGGLREQACQAASGVPGFQTCDSCAFGPCGRAFAKRMKLTLNSGASVPSAVADVPVLVVLTPTNVTYGDIAADGSDLRFFQGESLTPLPYEIERWNPAGDSYVWVRVPSLYGVADPDYLWLYYKPTSTVVAAAYPQPTGSVWDGDFRAVWHLGEDQSGTANPDVYADATGNGFAADDAVAATDKTGIAGPGQGLGSNDEIVIPAAVVSGLTEITVELWLVAPNVQTATYRRAVTVGGTGTPMDDYQAFIALDSTFPYGKANATGRDISFYVGNSRVDHWIEKWNDSGTSWIWVKVPTTGTKALTMSYGSPTANSGFDPTLVLDAGGLWRSQWNINNLQDPTSNAEMNALLAGVSGTAPDGQGAVTSLKCASNCGPRADDFVNLLEGWFVAASAGSYNFCANSDDASDIHIGDASWEQPADATLVASYYGNHGDWGWHCGTITLAQQSFNRLALRHEDSNAGDSYDFGVGATPATIPSTQVYYRKRAANPPAITLGADAFRGLAIRQNTLYVGGARGGIGGGVGSSEVYSTGDTGWTYVAVTYTAGSVSRLELYRNGESVMSTAPAAPLTLTTDDLKINVGFTQTFAASVDEVRISAVPRSASYFRVQDSSVRNTLFTYGAVEDVP